MLHCPTVVCVIEQICGDPVETPHLHHHSVTQILLDKITILIYTASPRPPPSLVPPTATNHDPPHGGHTMTVMHIIIGGGPPSPLGVRSLTS